MFLVIVSLVTGWIILSGFIIMVLWNLLVPDLVNGPNITFLHGIGLSMALGILGSVFRA